MSNYFKHCCGDTTRGRSTKKWRHKILRALWLATIGTGAASFTDQVLAAYDNGFQWVRSADWTPGTVNNSTTGNPDGDAMANPTWYYERSQGGNLASANPWYAQPRSLQLWRSGAQQWQAGTADQFPFQSATAMGQADVNFTFASPVVRWQNPTRLSLVVDISFRTDVVSLRQDGNSEELELAVVKLSGTYSLLWSTNRIAPNNGVVQTGNQVTLKNIAVGPGDALLFTYRNKLDTPLGGTGSTAWFDAATITSVVPALKIAPAGSNAVVSWPAAFTEFALQQNNDLTSTNWVDATNAVNIVVQENQVAVAFSESAGNRFYRLKSRTPLNVSRMPIPPRVWGTWNDFPILSSWANTTNVNEQYIMELVDHWSTNGMRDAGWNYIVLEEGWNTGLDGSGSFVINTTRFPSGLTNLCDYIRARGFIPGIYTSVAANAGNITCEGYGATCYTKLDQHFQQFADWGFEFVFVDNCGIGYVPWTDVLNQVVTGLDALYLQRLRFIYAAIEKTHKPISFLCAAPYNLADTGFYTPASYPQLNITMKTPDSITRWDFIPNLPPEAIAHNAYTNSIAGWAAYTQPGHYFYQGLLGWYIPTATYKTAFCLQSMMAGALFIDSGVHHIFSAGNSNVASYLGPDYNPPSTWDSDYAFTLKTNLEIASIHQDPAVIPATMVYSNSLAEIWTRRLGRSEPATDYALLLLNLSATNKDISVPFSLFTATNSHFTLRDVVERTNCGTFTNTATFTITPTNCLMLRATQVVVGANALED